MLEAMARAALEETTSLEAQASGQEQADPTLAIVSNDSSFPANEREASQSQRRKATPVSRKKTDGSGQDDPVGRGQ